MPYAYIRTIEHNILIYTYPIYIDTLIYYISTAIYTYCRFNAGVETPWVPASPSTRTTTSWARRDLSCPTSVIWIRSYKRTYSHAVSHPHHVCVLARINDKHVCVCV